MIIKTLQKGTKSALETARSFSTMLMDDGLRVELQYAADQQSFKVSFDSDHLIPNCNRSWAFPCLFAL